MGNTKSGAMSKEILEELKMNTKFTEMELVQWYENFKRQCPTERITKEEFQEIYSKFFPDSDAQTYSQHVFRSFDTNADGTLDFKEYIIALHMTSTGKTTTMKLEWAFGLFDVDKNGYITKSEVKEICTVSSGESLVDGSSKHKHKFHLHRWRVYTFTPFVRCTLNIVYCFILYYITPQRK